MDSAPFCAEASRGGANACVRRHTGVFFRADLDNLKRGIYMASLQISFQEQSMSHKKIERAKELDRRRQRREDRLKQRIREAKAAAKSKA